MATSASTGTSTDTPDFAAGFDAAGERVRNINSKLLESAKKSGHASIDAYEKAVAGYVGVQQQLADATQLHWVSTVVKAQTGYLTELTAAYANAAREALK